MYGMCKCCNILMSFNVFLKLCLDGVIRILIVLFDFKIWYILLGLILLFICCIFVMMLEIFRLEIIFIFSLGCVWMMRFRCLCCLCVLSSKVGVNYVLFFIKVRWIICCVVSIRNLVNV